MLLVQGGEVKSFLRERMTIQTNKFYIVRAMDKGEKYEVRHSDNPNLVWARVDSMEDGQEKILELQLDWAVDQAVTDFLEKLGTDLSLDKRTTLEYVRRCVC